MSFPCDIGVGITTGFLFFFYPDADSDDCSRSSGGFR